MPNSSTQKKDDAEPPDSVIQMTIRFLETVHNSPNATKAQKAEAKKLIKRLQ
jgi:hypothetical protein